QEGAASRKLDGLRSTRGRRGGTTVPCISAWVAGHACLGRRFMTLNMNRYRAVVALIASLFVCAGASAQQYNIRLNYSPGDKFEFATQEEFKTKISVSSGQMVLQEFDQVMNKRRAGTMEVL